MYSTSNLVKLQSLISNGNYDIVHTHNTACHLFGAMCLTPRRTRMVTTEHNTTNSRRGNGVLKLTDRMMYSAYDKIVCVSDLTMKALSEYLGGKIADKCEVITNGIDLDKYNGNIGKINPEGDVVVTMVAGFRKQKDHVAALRAFAILPDNFKLVFVG